MIRRVASEADTRNRQRGNVLGEFHWEGTFENARLAALIAADRDKLSHSMLFARLRSSFLGKARSRGGEILARSTKED
jgi:hypothetical protein